MPALVFNPRVRWAAAVISACGLAALVATWPLATQLTSAIPLGTEHESTVPVFSLWGLWWTADRAAHGFADYWNAPFFYPDPGVFTFSEPQVLTGLVVAPLWLVGAPPALAYNLALLALLTLNGAFAYRLARALEVPRLPALAAGVMAVTLPFVSKILGALPIVPLFGMLWTLDGLVRYGRSASPRDAAWAAAGFVAEALTSQQLALLFAPFAAAAGLVALAQQGFRPRPLGWLAAAGVGAGLLLLPVVLPTLQTHARYGFKRDETLVQVLSAQPGDFLTRPATALVPIPPPEDSFASDTGGLFPGLILLALALVGGLNALDKREQRGWTIYLVATVVGAALLAMGLNLNLAGWQPFAALRAVAPGLAELRSPYRYAAIAQVCLPVLAALGLHEVVTVPGRRGAAVIVALGLLAAAENLSVPAPLTGLPPTPRTPWTTWLRAQPDATVVAHVPFPAGGHVADYALEATRMYAQIDHHQPIVNGYSSFFPPDYTQLQFAMLQAFPDYGLLCVLSQERGVNTLVVDQAWLATHQEQMQAESIRALIQPLYADADVQIYRLAPPPSECLPRPP